MSLSIILVISAVGSVLSIVVGFCIGAMSEDGPHRFDEALARKDAEEMLRHADTELYVRRHVGEAI